MNKEKLENMPTSELDEILNAELRKDIPDADLVRMILRVLEEREKDVPVEITPEIQAAWNRYNQKDQRRAERPAPRARSWVIRTASMAAIICLLICVIPMEAEAESWWERVARWTDSFFEFVSPEEAEETEPEYVFQTDNPGLQEVYDAVTELGVTVPVVPMWLPDGAELRECKEIRESGKVGVRACFQASESTIVLKYDMYNTDANFQLQKDDSSVIKYESSGVAFNLTKNNDKWVVAWTKGNNECSVTMKCDESTIYKVIESIHTGEIR